MKNLTHQIVLTLIIWFTFKNASFALDTELHGFADARFGMRTQNDPNEDQQSLAETRLQLDALTYLEQAELQIRADFLYDAIESNHRKIDLEKGEGFVDLREFNLLFSPLDWADVKVGRQILTWGHGDLLFINDLFPKDWNSFLLGRDEEYLKAPSDALYASLFPSFANIDLVYTPRFDADRYLDGDRASYWNPMAQQIVGQNAAIDAAERDDWFTEDEIAMRIYRDLAGWETAFYYYNGYWKSPSGIDLSTAQAIHPKLNVYGASAKGTVGNGILKLETGYYDSIDESTSTQMIPKDELRFMIGYDRELKKNLSAGLQYYQEWMMDYDNYLSNSLVKNSTAKEEIRHVLTLRLTQMLMHQNLILGLFAFYSPSDNDIYLRPNMTYKLSDHWTFSGGANIFAGEDKHTFYGQFRHNSNAYIGIRYGF